jgi:hypothetical protein
MEKKKKAKAKEQQNKVKLEIEHTYTLYASLFFQPHSIDWKIMAY